MAAIAAHDPTRSPSLRILALGSGTKFMPSDVARSDEVRRERVRDSHAEILARRALCRYLYREMAEHHDSATCRQNSNGILEPCETGTGRWRLRDGVTLHLYVSTAPCGWASGVAGAARNMAPPQLPDLGPDYFPVPAPVEMTTGLPLLAKGSGGDPATLPPGCILAADATTMSCSDKIASWQMLGLEGALLSHLVNGPLRLHSITVGRKIDHVRCARALARWGYPVAVLRTGVTVEANLAAVRGRAALGEQLEKGDGDESLVWSLGELTASRHDGRTGAPIGETTGCSPVSGAKLLAELNKLRLQCGQPTFACYADAKGGRRRLGLRAHHEEVRCSGACERE
eukprot:gnl/TRDRNA2_/TRDRNA2_120275_c2_seq1.p1 gnl/TRDRNA2_/TRDRNA2_120275_c2~~gnl/TRDRNA2_/TRDRNA2_120275_c2_seq1.p1  ORF type:complete len:367 (-),score=38.04 gnl/TRDRNA2_/TRDRNA2_120275_c2_seq1:58-1086(-)